MSYFSQKSMLEVPRTVYLLVKYSPMGTKASIQLGGGSSSNPMPRVYDDKKKAERYAKVYDATIIEVKL